MVVGDAAPPRRLQITGEQRARVVTVYQTGATLEASAEAAGCSTATAWQHLKRLGLQRPQGPGRDVASQIHQALAEGLTPWEVARRLGLRLDDVVKRVRGC